MSYLLELGLTMAETRVICQVLNFLCTLEVGLVSLNSLQDFQVAMSQLVCAYISTYVEAN